MFYGDIKKLGEHDYAHKHNFYAQIFLLNVILYYVSQDISRISYKRIDRRQVY